jgi:uncharacterized protein (DUF885 family)
MTLMAAVVALALQGATPPAPAELAAVLAEEWEFRLREDPLLATAAGDRRYDDRLPSMARDDLDRRDRFRRATLARLRALDAGLTEEDRVNRDMLARELEDAIADHSFGGYRMPWNADSGFHTALPQLPVQMPFATVRDYERYVARLRAMPDYVRQQVALLREGVRAGFTIPRAVLAGFDQTIRAHVVDDPARSVFFAPFESIPQAIPAAERERLRAAGLAAVRGGPVAAYRELLRFYETEYLPGARASVGASHLPRGREYYAWLVKSFTTLDVTPEQVHRTGLAEVARIRAEMDGVMRRTGFTGDFPAFLAFLRADPRFYARTPEELLAHASRIAKRIDGRLPLLFSTLPRLPYGVEPVPAHMAPKYTSGRYVEPPMDGSRAGIYWVNTHALESRPLYALPALTLHEAVPGHHLQIALQREMAGVPPFRRASGVGAFVEGWALYAERLGLEVGMYDDPYDDFGRLTYEMWRACRLVVDTGLHSMGWTRQQAIEYLAGNTALSLHEVTTEIDRYISWPGQALAYKMGELKIRELRASWEKELGPRFDLRAFHAAVLEHGPVPLDVLDRLVRARAAEERARALTPPSGGE